MTRCPRSLSSRVPSYALVACLILALAATAGCSVTTGGTGGGTTTAGPTATATAAPTTCAQLSSFGSAVAATPVTGFNYGLPSNTVQATPQTSAGGAGRFTIYDIDLCAPNTTTALPVGANQKPLGVALQFYGWGPLQAFPLGGDALQACPSGVGCYSYQVQTKNSVTYVQQPPQFLVLQNIQDRGNGLVTFHLKLAAPPAAPNCSYDPSFDSIDQALYGAHPVYELYLGAPPHTANSSFSGVQLPPVTRMYPEGATGHAIYHMCSAGTAVSVNAFMFNQLTTNGWTGCSGQPAPTAAGGCFAYSFTATCGPATISITIAVTNAAEWGFSYGKPCFGI
jgi:hypothetical protein